MTPLGMVTAGLGLVVADLRLNGFDVIPDLLFLWSNRSDPALGAQRGVPTRPGPLGA